MTLHDQYLKAFQLQGWTPIHDPRVSRYTVLAKSGSQNKLFLGSSGAVRIGRTRTTSVPMRDETKAKLLRQAEPQNIVGTQLGL